MTKSAVETARWLGHLSLSAAEVCSCCRPCPTQGWGAKSQLHLDTISGLAHSWQEEEEAEE